MSGARKQVRRSFQRGATLIEVMVAAAVLVLGLLGLLAAQIIGARQNHMAARQTRAVAVAQDLAAAVRQWPCCDPAGAGFNALDPRLVNNLPGNDGAIVESGRVPGGFDPTVFDLDVDAATPGGYQPPMAVTALDFNGNDAPDFRRHLHIRPLIDPTMTPPFDVIGLEVAVVVAWQEELGWRQVVLRQSKYDPGNSIPGI